MTAVVKIVRPAAWALYVCVVFGVVAHLLWQWREAIIIAVFSAVVLLLSIFFILGRYRLAATFQLSANRVVVGQPATGSLLIRNLANRSAASSTVSLPVGATRADFDLPRLAAHAEHDELFTIPTDRRAVLPVGPVVAVRADPFGMLERSQQLTEVQDLYVHPRTVHVEGSAAGLIRDLEGQTTRVITDSDMSFHALRDYIPGDDRRYIHWRHSARTGDLMVRQFDETRRSHLLLVLSTRPDDYADPEEFELAISAVGSLGLRVLRDRQELTAMTTAQLISTHTSRRFLDALSGLDCTSQAASLSDTVQRQRWQAQSVSVAIMVGGSALSSYEIRRAHRFLPPDVRPIAIRADQSENTSIRRLGQIDVVSLAHLDELGQSIRKLVT